MTNQTINNTGSRVEHGMTQNSPAVTPDPIRGPGKPSVSDPYEAVVKGGATLLDVLSPKSVEVDFNHIKIGNTYYRTLFVAGYPRFVSPGWLEPVVNFNASVDISFYIYPVDGKSVLDDLRRKITEMEAEIATDLERGKILDPATEAKLEDARALQEELVKGAERFFEFGFYLTIPAATIEELDHVTKQVESTLGSLLAIAKKATLDMSEGFLTTAPMGFDRLAITRNMDSTSLSTTFPLTSAELSSDKGVLYGLNSQNESFIIFDRFSLENSNMTIFATSGAGKSTDYDEPIVYQNQKGEIVRDKIGKVVDQLFETNKPIRLEKDIDGVLKPRIKVFSFDKSLKSSWSKTTIVARKTAPKQLYKITTKSGRSVKITKDHCLVTLSSGQIKTTRGDSVAIGDYIPLPRKISIADSKFTPIDVYETLVSQYNNGSVVRQGNRIGAKHFLLKTSLPEKLTLTPLFFEFLGYYTAEGMNNIHKILISSTTPEVLSSCQQYFESLNIAFSKVFKNKKQIGVYASSQPFVRLMTILGVTGKAGDKKVPSLIFNASNKEVAIFLRCYFEGDGTVSKNEISATTKSYSLASDLSYLLYRFGIISRISRTLKRATNSAMKQKRIYYKINISGQENIKQFSKHIGFVTTVKNSKLISLIKNSNTNVDLIPGLGPIFKEIYQSLYNSTEIPAPKKFSEIKLGIFKPSRENLLGVISQIEKRVAEIESLKGNEIKLISQLPTVEEIVQKANIKKINRDLWKKLNKSWATIKNDTCPYLHNYLEAVSISHGFKLNQKEVSQALYKAFKITGISLRKFDKSLWGSVVLGNNNPRYDRTMKAIVYLTKKYEEKIRELEGVKKDIVWLKTLATSDLFWDPIVKIEKVKYEHKYVYDLQVDNEVFLAGFGGMFIHNSFFVKLEAIRSLMLGTEVIIVDPEAEYKAIAEAVGGEFISFSFNSPSKINPFDLSQVYVEGENQLGLKLLTLHSFLKVITGELDPIKEALLDRALVMTYRQKGITQDPATQTKEPPLMEDLYKTLIGMETPDALDIAARIEKFVRGSFVGIFDQQTNIEINNPFTVFSVKDMQDALRPIAMFMILDFIWTRVQKTLKRRLLVIEEAWHMMKHKDSAQFLWGVVKRARKYYLGLTTITQDIEDFLSQDIGKAIVTNSALRVLLKQSPAAIDKIAEVFYLSQGEKQLLLSANIGEGIFFAGPHHAPIKIVASQEEYDLITTKPEEMLKASALKGAEPSDSEGEGGPRREGEAL